MFPMKQHPVITKGRAHGPNLISPATFVPCGDQTVGRGGGVHKKTVQIHPIASNTVSTLNHRNASYLLLLDVGVVKMGRGERMRNGARG